MANEAKLDDLSPYQVLMTALNLKKSAHEVKDSTSERKVWINAENEAQDDLILLGGKPTTKKAKTIPPMEEEHGFDELLDHYMGLIKERFQGLTSAKQKALIRKSRCFPITSMATPEWDGVRELAVALSEALVYTDTEGGDDKIVPPEGEALIELWERGREMRRQPGEGPDWHGLVALRGDDIELTPFSIKQTFRDGQWISHKKFGPGYVVEAREKCRVLFEDGERLLMHVAAPTQKFESVASIANAQRDSKVPSVNIEGMEVTRLPPDPKLSPDYDEDAEKAKRRR